MILEECLGKKCAEAVKNIFAYALKSGQENREILVESLRYEADKQVNITANVILIQIATQIESMEVTE
ncbi:hypothetical protein [Enterococcus alishanensis]